MTNRIAQGIRNMASAIPKVDIDPNGVFKYILVKLNANDESAGNVVRGYAECGYHSDIEDKFTEQLEKMKKSGTIKSWKTKVLGGGRIQHDPDAKTLKVYGYSQGFGKADHQVTVALLKEKYPDYNITCSDEGY